MENKKRTLIYVLGLGLIDNTWHISKQTRERPIARIRFADLRTTSRAALMTSSAKLARDLAGVYAPSSRAILSDAAYAKRFVMKTGVSVKTVIKDPPQNTYGREARLVEARPCTVTTDGTMRPGFMNNLWMDSTGLLYHVKLSRTQHGLANAAVDARKDAGFKSNAHV